MQDWNVYFYNFLLKIREDRSDQAWSFLFQSTFHIFARFVTNSGYGIAAISVLIENAEGLRSFQIPHSLPAQTLGDFCLLRIQFFRNFWMNKMETTCLFTKIFLVLILQIHMQYSTKIHWKFGMGLKLDCVSIVHLFLFLWTDYLGKKAWCDRCFTSHHSVANLQIRTRKSSSWMFSKRKWRLGIHISTTYFTITTPLTLPSKIHNTCEISSQSEEFGWK